ncbi:unnamed protein product [Kuraishia capsulata CBS 1993]|uniref:Phytanoyl-CoA dioxygenase n=1 Tax=Kuraishia capsulata CBS 1993 TaxID=1382522 RepID=W6MJ83_9ASCO|nr:uncharacterized protein KUCA_T00002282001 [Kuraishia capsulata CBS 1993]CDK26311.1 unnamed protein product [Kuraishia capsulata CBS 1993]
MTSVAVSTPHKAEDFKFVNDVAEGLEVSSVGQIKTSKVDPEVFLEAQKKVYGITHGDWRDDFVRDGYAIVRGAIPLDRALGYRKRMLDYIQSFDNPELDLNDRSTWVAKNLPAHNKNNIYFSYCCAHEDFMWDVRLEPGVIAAFSTLWGTDELLVSFDGFNVSFPGRPDRDPAPGWPHVDQSPFKKGLHCAQGIVNLSNADGPEDGSLTVVKGSHKLVPEFFENLDRESWEQRDFYSFSEEQYKDFLAKGCEVIKLDVAPGDLILWDSRTIHWGQEPSPKSNVIRTVIYASYTPSRFATEDTIQMKAELFRRWCGSTHWAHDNLRPRLEIPLLPDGSKDPRSRTEPKNKPELTDKLLRLAGVLPYDKLT